MLEIPEIVSVSITDKCNLKCLYCSRYATYEHSELSLPLFQRLIDELANIGVGGIGITGGEPLIKRDFLKLVSYTAEYEIPIGITTNGIYLDDRIITELKRLDNLQLISISIDGASPEVNDAIRGQGTFDKAISAIKRCLREDLPVHMATTIMRQNLHEVPKLINLSLRLGLEIYRARRLIPMLSHFKGQVPRTFEYKGLCEFLSRNRSQLSKNGLELLIDEPLMILVEDNHAKKKSNMGSCSGGCQAGKTYCSIQANGDVVPCSFLYYKVGNIKEKKFEDIWFSSHVLSILRGSRNLKRKCGKCHLAKTCGGCRAMAHAVYGDMLAEDPLCWM